MTGISRRGFLLSSLLGSGLLAGPGRRSVPGDAFAQDIPPEIVPGIDRETVEALMERIVPGDGTPGARDAGCSGFLVKLLADEASPFREVYRVGLEGVAGLSSARFGKAFVELGPDEQDQILGALEVGSAPGWPEGGIAPQDFFEALRTHTIWGFLADPKYGGNRHYAGWRVAGYPGPGHRKGIRPKQLTGEEEIVPIWDPRY